MIDNSSRETYSGIAFRSLSVILRKFLSIWTGIEHWAIRRVETISLQNFMMIRPEIPEKHGGQSLPPPPSNRNPENPRPD